jgi:anti-anti-sigma factor
VCLAVRGEFDLAAVEAFGSAIDAALGTGPIDITLDLADLTFCDSSGLRSLLQASDRCEQRGVRLRLVQTGGIVRRVLELSGVAEMLDIVEG